MKVPALPAALVATLFLCSCTNSETPTGPSMSGSGAPGPSFLSGPSASALWKGTRTVVSSTGPDDCFVQGLPNVGMGMASTFGVLANRNGNGIEIIWGDPTFTYQGAIAGSAFTAVAQSVRGYWTACVGFSYSSIISGTFSADGRQLTADATETYVLDSGQTNTFTYHWVLAE